MLIDRPRGFVPRSKGCNLPANYAQKAQNLNTLSRRFEPWREPLELIQFDEPIASAHVRDCCWTGHYDPNTTYHDAGVDRKTYRSVPGEPIMATDSVCDPHWTYLGYPVPDAPVVVSDTVDKGPDTETVTFVITYGTECEEGPASCPSDEILTNKESHVSLSLPAAPEHLWGATLVRIYKSATLWDPSQGLADLEGGPIQRGWTDPASQQEFFLVAELPLSQRQVVISLSDEIGRKLTTSELLPAPPEARVGGDTELGSLVIFWANSIAFSERNRYWGFPLKTWHDFPFEVKDVKVCNNTVFVLTCGAVYVIQDDVDCRDSNARQVLEVKGDNVPSHCLSCVELPDGVLYTSQAGLVFLNVQGTARVVSGPAFAKDDWNQLGPIRALTIGCGLLIVSTDQEDVVWELAFDDQGNLPADLSTLSFCADQWTVDDQGHLYFLADNNVYQFNAGDEYMSMDWWQAEQRGAARQRVSALSVDYVKKNSGNRNVVSVYRDGELSILKELGDRPRRVRSTATSCLQLRVKGNEPMCSLSYGQGLNSLRQT